MSITLCLVTKGRERYQQPLLDSLTQILKIDGVNLMIILNGTPKNLVKVFEEFASEFEEKVVLKYIFKNDARPSAFWSQLKEIDTKWIAFPSDDDILEPAFFSNFKEFDLSYGDYGAVATSLSIINEDGKISGDFRFPYIQASWPNVTQVARAFHQCPFLWPGLVIQTNRLPELVPNSRFSSDWWIGIFLLLTTTVAISQDIMIQYRVHDGQESNLAPLNRKNFESLRHLGELVDSKFFLDWLKKLDNSELCNFLVEIEEFLPIYADPIFGPSLVFKICGCMQKLDIDKETEFKIILLQSKIYNVLLGFDQAKYLSTKTFDGNYVSSPNFNVHISPTSCRSIFDTFSKMKRIEKLQTIEIYCKHGKKSVLANGIQVSCQMKKVGEINLDFIIYEIENGLAAKGLKTSTVSPREFRIVLMIRNIKRYLPIFLLKRFKDFFKS